MCLLLSHEKKWNKKDHIFMDRMKKNVDINIMCKKKKHVNEAIRI